MSIINEAIKKARKEFIAYQEGYSNTGSSYSEKKWIAVIVASLIVIISLFGSFILYRHLSVLDKKYDGALKGKVAQGTGVKVSYIEGKRATVSAVTDKSLIRLNGIVYGPQDKWAIINDKIIREGDEIQDVKVTAIEKDFVKVTKSDGEEILLNLE